MSLNEQSEVISSSISYYEEELPDPVSMRASAPILLFADELKLRERCRRIISAAGYLVTGNRGLSDAGAALSRQRNIAAVITCIAELDAQSVHYFHQVEQQCREQQLPLLLVANIDVYRTLATSAEGTSCGHILHDPNAQDDVQLVAEINASLQMNIMKDHREQADTDSIEMRKINAGVEQLARKLDQFSETPPASGTTENSIFFTPSCPAEQLVTAAQLRDLIRGRRLRDRFFDAELFADPAWDMLLDLLAARLEDTNVSVSSLCIAASVPPTTALRWIKTMTDQGIFHRQADRRDGRRIFIKLSDRAMESMLAYFALLREEKLMLA